MKIFVSICSYRDPLLVHTLNSLIQSKSQITDATYAIFEQIEKENSLEVLHPELVARADVIYKRIDPQYSQGVGWARNVNALNIEDEDFYYQIDSHMLFDKNWDRRLISDYKEAAHISHTNRIIISDNCKNFEMIDGTPSLQHNRSVSCEAKFYQFEKNLWLYAHGNHFEASQRVKPSIHVFAGNFFTHADWLSNVGIDSKIFFHGEEQIIMLSSFAAGYKSFHGKQISCYHYLDSNNHTSKQDVEPVVSNEILESRKKASIEHFKKYIQNTDDSILEAFKEYSGVDYINRKLEERAITRSIQPSIEVDWEIADATLKPEGL